jgi:hypothetical protein
MEFLGDSSDTVPAVGVRLATRNAELPLLQVEAVAAASLDLQEIGSHRTAGPVPT